MPTNSRVRLRDSFVLDGVHRSADGYLAGSARVARTGTQVYSGRELGRPDLETVTLFRPESEVFNKDAMHSMAHRPVTMNHPPDMVDAKNWSKYAKGQTGDEVVRDGDCIRVPMVLMDHKAIEAVMKDNVRELSMGYTTDLDWTPGTTPQGEKYDAVQTNIRGNHLAVVPAARGGARLRFGDAAMKCADCGKPWMEDAKVCDCGSANMAVADRDWTEEERKEAEKKGHAMAGGKFPIEDPADVRAAVKLYGRSSDPAATKVFIIKRAKAIGAASELPDDWKSGTNDGRPVNDKGKPMHTIMLDGQKLDVADELTGTVITKREAALLARIADAEKKAKDDDDEMEDEKKKAKDAATALQAQLSAKDGEILVLKKRVADAELELSPQKIGERIADRAKLIDSAKPMLTKDFAFTDKTDDEIRKAVVVAKLGDAAKDLDAAGIAGAFKALSLVKVSDGAHRLGSALEDAARGRDNASLTDGDALRDAAYLEMIKDTANAWKTPTRN